jgi:hypothetical protein
MNKMFHINWSTLQSLLDGIWFIAGLPGHNHTNDTMYLIHESARRDFEQVHNWFVADARVNVPASFPTVMTYELVNQYSEEVVKLVVVNGVAMVSKYSLTSEDATETLDTAPDPALIANTCDNPWHKSAPARMNMLCAECKPSSTDLTRLPFEPSFHPIDHHDPHMGTIIVNGNGEKRGQTFRQGRREHVTYSAWAGSMADLEAGYIGTYPSDAEALTAILHWYCES